LTAKIDRPALGEHCSETAKDRGKIHLANLDNAETHSNHFAE
jgi:hypothetical protein